MVLDAIEGDLVTKADFAMFREQVDRRFTKIELRLVIKLGLIMVTCTSFATAILGWLIKVQ